RFAPTQDERLVPWVDGCDAHRRDHARGVEVPPVPPHVQHVAGRRVRTDSLHDPATPARPLDEEALAVDEPVPPDGRVRAERPLLCTRHGGSMTTRSAPPPFFARRSKRPSRRPLRFSRVGHYLTTAQAPISSSVWLSFVWRD